MHEILREVDVNSNGIVELDEFLQVDWNIQKAYLIFRTTNIGFQLAALLAFETVFKDLV